MDRRARHGAAARIADALDALTDRELLLVFGTLPGAVRIYVGEALHQELDLRAAAEANR